MAYELRNKNGLTLASEMDYQQACSKLPMYPDTEAIVKVRIDAGTYTDVAEVWSR